MPIERVVVNASPIITLCRSRQAHLLPALFTEIVVPDAVWEEVVAGGADDPAARELEQAAWPVREAVEVSQRVAAWNLGAGESAVLSFGLRHPNYRCVVDDLEARRCARTLDLRFLGTGAILVLANGSLGVAGCGRPSAPTGGRVSGLGGVVSRERA
jgi:predicted nucleic acid-binding protein